MDGQCERVEKLIVDYTAGELDRSEMDFVEKHMRSCPRCSQAAGEIERIVSTLSHHEMVEPSAAVCDSVREAVRERVVGRKGALSAAATAAGWFVRRPVLVGASGLVAVAAVMLLFVVPALRHPEEPRGTRPPIELGGTILRQFQDYLSESGKLMVLVGGPDARETLLSWDWKTWVGQAMVLKETKGLEAYVPLFQELENLYWEIEACGGKFGEQQILRIRQFISEKELTPRIEEAISSRR